KQCIMRGVASLPESFLEEHLSGASSSGATPCPTVAPRNTGSRAAGWRIGMYTPSGVGPRPHGVPEQLAGRGAHHRTRTYVRFLFLALLLLAGWASASAQSLSPGGPVDFGGTPVGNTSGPTTLVFSVPAGDFVVVSSITAITEGAPNKDFAVAGQTCVGSFTGPTTCNIILTFAPSALGLRLGELVVKDGSGNVSNHVPLRGTGLGPQMIVSPASAVATASLTGITPTAINPSSTVYDGAGNLYTDDALNGRILETTPSGTTTLLASIPASTAAAPFSSIAISGDGTLYVSSPNTATIYKIPQGGSPTALPTPGVTLLQPAGLALDGFGYLYVADAGANQIVRIDVENGSSPTALTLTGLSTALSSPQGLSVDAADNLYVADANNNRIVKIDLHTTVGLTNPATVLPISGLTLSSPEAVVVNVAGGLTIADTGNSRLVELPLSGSPYVITLLGATPPATFPLTTPAGITLLPTGDLLVSDTVAGLVQVTRTTSSLTFPTSTLVGTTDTADGDLALNVENIGSDLLQISGS